MGVIENFKKLGYRFTSTKPQKSRYTQREALEKILTLIRWVDADETPFGKTTHTAQMNFSKTDVTKYTDAQVKEKLKLIKAIVNQKK